MIWMALAIPFFLHGDVKSEFVPPPEPTFDLLWGADTGIVWGADTIIDYPVIS